MPPLLFKMAKKTIGKGAFAKANKHSTTKVNYNPATGTIIRKNGTLAKNNKPRKQYTAPKGNPATHPLVTNPKGNPRPAHQAWSQVNGKIGPKIGVKSKAKTDVKSWAKQNNLLPKLGFDGRMVLLGNGSKSNNTAKSVYRNYSSGNPVNYGNYGYSGSTGSSVYRNGTNDPYSALMYMQDNANALNIAMNEYNNQFAADQAKLQRDWSTEMSNTAHQREVKDLQAAGLNPILSANAGAAVSSGASAGASGFQGANTDALKAVAGIIEASISASATTTAAALNANSSMYNADKSYEAAKYSSDRSYQSTDLSSGRSKYGFIDRIITNYDKILNYGRKKLKI